MNRIQVPLWDSAPRDLIMAVRRFVPSNLNWFLEARHQLGEPAGNERGININSPVMDAWFPGERESKQLQVRSYYFDYSDDGHPTAITSDARTINLQGGDRNWRLVGDAVEGAFYGSLRTYDLMIMMFNRANSALSWLCIRSGLISSAPRSIAVSDKEQYVYNKIITLLGRQNAGRSMWLPDFSKTQDIMAAIGILYPKSGALILGQNEMANQWLEDIDECGFAMSSASEQSDSIALRYILALKAKPFVILTGLAGSGKTLLAKTFASWISKSPDQYAVIPVGADWTNRDPIWGYLDALYEGRYHKPMALQLILRASNDPAKPYFLILDEMNLSHVERYFADVLSALESGEPISLHNQSEDIDDIPARLQRWPRNLFVIGTVNIDETTYMFSPKVLDRANVIEFHVSKTAIEAFTKGTSRLDINSMKNKGSAFGEGFVLDAISRPVPNLEIDEKLNDEIMLFFDALSPMGAEFGFRTVAEIKRYVYFRSEVDIAAPELFKRAIDAQVAQKLLPRLHGSRRKLEPVLATLLHLCAERDRSATTYNERYLKRPMADSNANGETANGFLQPAGTEYLPISYDKVYRMFNRLQANGFTSFAEA